MLDAILLTLFAGSATYALLWLAEELLTAPEGYESDDGFVLGRPGEGE